MHESEASSLGEKMGLMDRTDVSINSRMGGIAAAPAYAMKKRASEQRARLSLSLGPRPPPSPLSRMHCTHKSERRCAASSSLLFP